MALHSYLPWEPFSPLFFYSNAIYYHNSDWYAQVSKYVDTSETCLHRKLAVTMTQCEFT